MTVTRYMLDTNVFNALKDGFSEEKLLPEGGEFIVTSIQMRELQAHPDPVERERLLKIFNDVAAESVPTSAAVYGISEFNASEFSDGKSYSEFLDALNAKKKRDNNQQDTLIALTAIQKGCTLVTSDVRLAEVTKAFGGTVYRFPYGSGKSSS